MIKKYIIYIIIDMLFIIFNFLDNDITLRLLAWGIISWFFIIITFTLNLKNIIDTIIDKKEFNIILFINTFIIILLSMLPYNKIKFYMNYKINYLERMAIINKIQSETITKNTYTIPVKSTISKSNKVIVIQNNNDIYFMFCLSSGLISTEAKNYLIYSSVNEEKIQEKISKYGVKLNDFYNLEKSWYIINVSEHFKY